MSRDLLKQFEWPMETQYGVWDLSSQEKKSTHMEYAAHQKVKDIDFEILIN